MAKGKLKKGKRITEARIKYIKELEDGRLELKKARRIGRRVGRHI